MTPQVARGFVSLMLRMEEIDLLNQTEKKFPWGRYWIPCEISALFRRYIKKSISPEQESEMESVWVDFCRKKNIDQKTLLGDHDLDLEWMLYARKNYQEPLPAVSSANWEVA